MFWDEKIETMARPELQALQLKRLQSQVRRMARHVPFYQKKFAELGLKPSQIKSLDDVRRLPFTTGADLRDSYPRGLVINPDNQIVRLHTSSGTTGKPKALFFSRKDIDQAAELVARCLVMSGLTSQDVVQNMMTYGMFTGALMFHYGVEKVGAMIIPVGPGNSEKQLLLMQDFGTTAIHVTAGYALYFADFLQKKGIDPRKDLKLKRAYVGAEAYSEETRRKIEEAFGVQVFNCYGLSEMNGPGVGFECTSRRGMHIWEDNYLLEIIDPATGEVLPDGATGEMVLTSLCREAMPILRYRTRDITSIISEPCPCGRTHRRINRITGRSDDMLIVRGSNVYPQQIERVLMSFPEVGRNWLIRLEGLDEMIIQVEFSAENFDGQVDHLVSLQNRIIEKMRAEIMVRPRIELVAPGTLPVSEGKAKRVIDHRVL
jgi:phenylacetate-CoA ligase